jgi:hypothetical protein
LTDVYPGGRAKSLTWKVIVGNVSTFQQAPMRVNALGREKPAIKIEKNCKLASDGELGRYKPENNRAIVQTELKNLRPT